MFSDCYGECAIAEKGIVKPDDTCGKAESKYTREELAQLLKGCDNGNCDNCERRKILDIGSAICWGSVVLCLATLCIIDFYLEKVPTGRNRYTAIVDDSADYKEIVEKYNIIESHGKIWVLEDK
jgi:hypothetical protein